MASVFLHSWWSSAIIFISIAGSIYCARTPSCSDPAVWCSSAEMASNCEVLDQCNANVWRSQYASRVLVTLHYECLCPDCRNFTTQVLSDVYKKLYDIIDIQLIPYGNSKEKFVDGKWEFTCQHGPAECLGNTIATCAVHFNPDRTIAFPFVLCMELSRDSPDISGPKCAAKYKLDYGEIDACVKGPVGNTLQHQMAVLTDALDTPHTSVPWVTINGNGHNQDDILTHLTRYICDAYTGPITNLTPARIRNYSRNCTSSRFNDQHIVG